MPGPRAPRRSISSRRPRRPRSFPGSTSESLYTGTRGRKLRQRQGYQPVSTVTRGGKTRAITYRGVALPGGGVPVSKAARAADNAERRAANVAAAVKRVRKAYGSGLRAGKTYDPDEAAALVKSVGGSDAEARALSTKVLGESSGNPKAIGNDPGGTTGLGLWQLTTGVGNDDLIAKYGGPRAMLKPKPNARAALELYRTSSSKLGNWYAPSNPPGDPSRVPPAVKPKRKDLKTLRKAGINPKQVGREVGRSGPHPFGKAAAKSGRVNKLVNPKWEPDDSDPDVVNKLIAPVLRKFTKRYGVDVTAGFDPEEGEHQSPGHNVTGTATDLVPKGGWSGGATRRFERGLKFLESQGFEVGYGTDGIGLAWPNHGRGNHAHVEWVGQGSSTDAIKRLGGVTDAQIRSLENSAPGGVGGFSPSQVAAYASATGVSLKQARQVAKNNPKQFQQIVRQRLARIREAYGEGGSLTRPSRRRGAPVL